MYMYHKPRNSEVIPVPTVRQQQEARANTGPVTGHRSQVTGHRPQATGQWTAGGGQPAAAQHQDPKLD